MPAAGRRRPCLWLTRAIAESEDILRYADEHLDEDQRLFPAEPRLRDEVIEVSRWLDDGLGPDGRRLMYAHMLTQRRQMLPRQQPGRAGLGGPPDGGALAARHSHGVAPARHPAHHAAR